MLSKWVGIRIGVNGVLAATPGWYFPLDANTDNALAGVFEQLTGGVKKQPVSVMISGREIIIPYRQTVLSW